MANNPSEFNFEEFEEEFRKYQEEEGSERKFTKDSVRDFVEHQKEQMHETFGIDPENVEIDPQLRVIMNCLMSCDFTMMNIPLVMEADEIPDHIAEVIVLVGTAVRHAQATVVKEVIKQVTGEDIDEGLQDNE